MWGEVMLGEEEGFLRVEGGGGGGGGGAAVGCVGAWAGVDAGDCSDDDEEGPDAPVTAWGMPKIRRVGLP